jgi:hypothetical protein
LNSARAVSDPVSPAFEYGDAFLFSRQEDFGKVEVGFHPRQERQPCNQPPTNTKLQGIPAPTAQHPDRRALYRDPLEMYFEVSELDRLARILGFKKRPLP